MGSACAARRHDLFRIFTLSDLLQIKLLLDEIGHTKTLSEGVWHESVVVRLLCVPILRAKYLLLPNRLQLSVK